MTAIETNCCDTWEDLFNDVGGCGDYEPDLESFISRALKLAEESRTPRRVYRVDFDMTHTVPAYVEAESLEDARDLAQELHAQGGAFLDELLGNAELALVARGRPMT